MPSGLELALQEALIERPPNTVSVGSDGTLVTSVYDSSSLVALVSLFPAVSWQTIYTVFAPSRPRSDIAQDWEVVPSPVQSTSSDARSYESSNKEARQSAASLVVKVIVGVGSVMVEADAGEKEEGIATVVSTV